MCQPRNSQKAHRAWECNCGCCECGCGTFFRRFISAKEEQEKLEKYRYQLQKELAGVEEHLKELNLNNSPKE